MWSSKTLGSNLKYGFFRTLVKARMTSVARAIAIPIPIYYALKPTIRKRAYPYLKRRFPNASEFELFWRTCLLYRNLADILLDRIILANGGEIPVKEDATSLRLIAEVLRQGHGCVIVSHHFGCWQNGLNSLVKLRHPIAVVFWQEAKKEHDFFRYDREVEIISACGGIESAMQMRNVLKKNGILCIMGDRVTPGDKHIEKVNFLGGEISVPSFPYMMAETLGSPVIFAASIRINGAMTGLPAALLEAPRNGPKQFAAFMENLVRQYPHHFFNFYDIWNDYE